MIEQETCLDVFTVRLMKYADPSVGDWCRVLVSAEDGRHWESMGLPVPTDHFRACLAGLIEIQDRRFDLFPPGSHGAERLPSTTSVLAGSRALGDA